VAVLSDLVAFLCGEWSVRRVINDGADGFTGTASFSARGDALRWSERGRLRLAGYAGPARRTYLIVPDGEAWAVRFDDGRPFHPLDLRRGHAEVEHLCGPDTYRGVYDVAGADRFSVTWVVTGPGRADTIVSDYRRDECRDARMSPSARTSA
jgi:hypothetical protein